MMWGMEIGKRLAEKRMKNTADLRKDIRFILEWHLSTLYCRKASIILVQRFFAWIRYTWPRFGQNQLHAKNKYITHPSAIGQADIITDFGSKRPRCTYLFCSTLSSFQLIWANFEPIREAIHVHCFFSPYASALPLLKISRINVYTLSSYAVRKST